MDGDPALAREALIDACGKLFDRYAASAAPRTSAASIAPRSRPHSRRFALAFASG